MKKTFSILVAVVLLSVGCANKTTKHTRYHGPVYVSSQKYEKTSCEELKSEFYYFKHIYTCAELKEYFFFILPTEYEKLSCKQLHTQFIKINQRYKVEEWQKEQDKNLIVFIPVLLATTGGLPLLNNVYTEPGPESYLDPNRISETINAKEAYETLKKVVAEKNCDFVKDMHDIK